MARAVKKSVPKQTKTKGKGKVTKAKAKANKGGRGRPRAQPAKKVVEKRAAKNDDEVMLPPEPVESPDVFEVFTKRCRDHKELLRTIETPEKRAFKKQIKKTKNASAVPAEKE